MHCHCGTNNRAPRWTFTDPCKAEVRPGAREESASPAWLAAPAMNARDTTKVYIWRLDSGCGPTLYRKCHSHSTPGKRHNNTWVEPLAGNCTTSSTQATSQDDNKVAAFQGMHVLPAKHSYECLPLESVTTGQTDRHTGRDRRQTRWSLCAAMLRRRLDKSDTIWQRVPPATYKLSCKVYNMECHCPLTVLVLAKTTFSCLHQKLQ